MKILHHTKFLVKSKIRLTDHSQIIEFIPCKTAKPVWVQQPLQAFFGIQDDSLCLRIMSLPSAAGKTVQAAYAQIRIVPFPNFQQSLQICWLYPVIRIGENNKISLCAIHPIIACGRKASVLLVISADTSAFLLIPVTDFRTFIRGTVIYQQKFKV